MIRIYVVIVVINAMIVILMCAYFARIKRIHMWEDWILDEGWIRCSCMDMSDTIENTQKHLKNCKEFEKSNCKKKKIEDLDKSNMPSCDSIWNNNFFTLRFYTF